MPTPIPSPLHSAINWLRASHLRLLIAGLVAVGLIGAVSIFAADPKDQDLVDIKAIGEQQDPKDGVTLGQDFKIRYAFKPHENLKKYNLRVTLNGQAIENRRWENANGASGTQTHGYDFRYGMNAERTQRELGFDWTLLRPGTHTLTVRACNNDLPSTSCKQLARKQLKFKIPEKGTGKSAKAIAIGETSLTVPAFGAGAAPITTTTDTRIKQNDPSAAQLAEELDSQNGNFVEPALTGDELTGDNAGNSNQLDGTGSVSSIIEDHFSLTEVAHATRGFRVWVNPGGLAAGQVTVTTNPAKCGPSAKVVNSSGYVDFGGCAEQGFGVSASPGSFQKDGQQCNIANGSATVPLGTGSATLSYNCNPVGGGGGGGGGGTNPPPAREPTTMRVWVNPHPKMGSTNITVNGASCGGNQTVGADGWADFKGCNIGEDIEVSVPKNRTIDGWDYQVGDNVRKFKVRKNEVVTFNYLGGDTGLDQTSQIKVWVNPIGRTPDKLEVTVQGPCAEPKKKKVGSDGTVTFGGCKVGAGYIVSVPAQFKDADGFVWHVGPNGRERKLQHLDASPQNNPISWVPEFHFTLNDGDTGDTVKKPGPMIALRSLSATQAIVDLFKFGAGPDFNIGQVKQLKAVVDGQVTDDHVPPVPPISVGGAAKSYKYFPTIKNEPLNLGNLADGKAHTVQLQAIATTGAVRTITVNVQPATPPPPPPVTCPDGSQPDPNGVCPQTGTGNVTAFVYNDKNGNGIREDGEAGLPDANVTSTVKTNASDENIDDEKDDDKDVQASEQGITVKTNAQGLALFADLPNGIYTVSAETLAGFIATSPSDMDVSVNNNAQYVQFGQQEEPQPEPSASPTATPSDAPTAAPTASPQGTPAPQASSAPAAVNAPQEQGTGTAQTQGVLGNLPKTGQAGLILFLTFLVASGIYYGGRKFLAKRNTK